MVDRLITINLRKYLSTQPRTKRARKAVKYIRERVGHFTKIKTENVKLGYELNNLIFKEYSRSMRPIKLRVKIGTDTADVLPFIEGEPAKIQAPQQASKPEKRPLVGIKKQEPKQDAKQEEKKDPAPQAKQTTHPKQAEKKEKAN